MVVCIFPLSGGGPQENGLDALGLITQLAVLAVFPVTLYIYAFFHANNIGGMDAEQFAALEDEYLFGIGAWDVSRFNLNMNKRNRTIAREPPPRGGGLYCARHLYAVGSSFWYGEKLRGLG